MDLSKEPIAIVGFACRLPGGNSNPQKLWDFLERGGIASNKVPETRFNINGHWDGSLKPRTMRPCGGMMLDYIDPADFDAPFFEISRAEAISMDPNQRQMLEVVYEALENTGISLESLDGAEVGCFVGSFASDYDMMQGRDPEDRPAGITVGAGRAILSNRLSHFLNIKGPSVTIDTACSGSLIGLDVACRYLKTREIDAAIVATSNLYLNPEHVMDTGAVGNAHSPTGLCHTFDESADGYVKAEAVSAIIVKRLSDAVRDRDPVRAIVRGSATNSDGRTLGIASPSAEAQAAAIRAAYRNAGITNLNDTAYLECHGTGTQAGDPMEVGGAGSVFSAGRSDDQPLIIGSVKSNVGHAEPAAGLSGLMKAIMAIEKGKIPGNPTFDNPSPKIDFAGLKVKATRSSIPWPAGTHRRASVNSFGYGGSNCHVVLDQASLASDPHHVSSLATDDDFDVDDDDDDDDDDDEFNPVSLILSANDEVSLKANIKALSSHLMNPRVKVSLADLAYTLSDRRSKHFHRAFVTTKTTEVGEKAFVTGKKHAEVPRIGFIFTGQGAQWPQMGRDLLRYFPWTRTILAELDAVLQSLPSPPDWSLISELVEPRSPEHLRQPEFSQPLVTALQLCFIDLLGTWGIKPHSVVGHSSGEIAAAHTAGLLSKADAIKAAYYRGRAAVNRKDEIESDVGMLAVGLGVEAVMPFMDNHEGNASIACFNSPNSVTISGKKLALEALKNEISAAGHFARMLQVDLAYHSTFMDLIGEEYVHLLLDSGFVPLPGSPDVAMYSSVTGRKKSDEADALYWKTNMVSPVRFDHALTAMLSAPDRPNFLIEIGPSGALAGPTSQIKKALGTGGDDILYCASWARGADAGKAMFDVAGRLFIAGGQVDFNQINRYDSKSKKPSVVIDLPNYIWNHSTKYWHENQASKDWRFKQHVVHDLLGSKVLSTSWKAPTWRKLLNLSDVPWLKDHKMGTDVIMPGAGYIAMALEAMYQSHKGNNPAIAGSVNDFSYRLRNIRFVKALVLEEGKEAVLLLSLTRQAGNNSWYEFRVSSTTDDVFMEHCNGLICIQAAQEDTIALESAGTLQYATSGHLWYKAQSDVGYGFGPSFQKLLKVESTSGQRHCRASVNLAEPDSRWNPQSSYSIHPASLDGCFQTVTPSLWSGERSSLNAVLVPSIIDDLIINKVPTNLKEGVSLASSEYTGRGRLEEAKSYLSNCSVYDSERGKLVMQMTGLRFAKLDTVVKPDPHTFDQIVWKPDIQFLSQDQLTYLSADSPASKIDLVIDLIAHKKPNLQILEISFDERDTSAMWLEDGDRASRAAYLNYQFASADAKQLVSVQMKHEACRDSSFFLVNQTKDAFGLESSDRDLIIVKVGEDMEGEMSRLIDTVRPLLSDKGYLIYVQQRQDTPGSPLSDTSSPVSKSSGLASELNDNSPATPESSISDSSRSEQTTGKILESVHSATSGALQAILSGLESSKGLQDFAAVLGFGEAQIITDSHTLSAYLVPPRWSASGSKSRARDLSVIRLAKETPPLTPFLKTILRSGGWNIAEHDLVKSSLVLGSTVLILDELSNPILTQTTSEQWDTLKGLVATGKKLLWVTKGAQMNITHPDNAMAHGLFRVVRMENAGAHLTCLDVQSSTSPAANIAISQILNYIDSDTSKHSVETEFAERDGIIHVHRIVPDDSVNAFRRYEREGVPTETRPFHANEAAVSLRAERLGTFQELTWCENSTSEVPVEAGKVEVEIHAAGVNFKDVAVIMGIVAENEFTIGYEAAGVVRRVGPGVSKFRIADRVCFLNNGSYANRLQVPVGRAHVIPDTMSFQDAATIPSVYLASMYSLFDMANLKKGQSVLIHSAAGGVGLSSIQLAQYIGAEVFVTVGTEEKRKFLTDNYGIPESRMFSSRDTKFAKSILEATDGRGVDVIINSLIGEMLDESWRICADGGTMVEIGKKDIIDRSMLSMEPFDRNCSFRAMDFSYTRDISDELIERLLDQIFDLLNQGHIKPIHPITTFSFDDISSALSYIRSGRHIGKVVISDGEKADVKIDVRPALPKLTLRDDVSYLIVGGMKGLCGNLAIHMAKHGAKQIIVCSRSGLEDEASKKTAANCFSYGCKVVAAKGDVADPTFVREIFRSASPCIAGVIQGAMVLVDKPYETMTLEDYNAAIHAKTRGTWALHHVSLEQKTPLDFFTLLSSISGIVGKKGQSNYSAANTFLDSFAGYRQSLGLRANAVDLGLIEDVGYVAEQGGMDSHFDKRQWTPISEGTLRNILDCSILQQTSPISDINSAQLITGIAFPLPDDSDLTREARFGYLFAQSASGGAGKEGGRGDETIRAFLMMHKSGADKTALSKLAVDLLVSQFTKILSLGVDMEPAKSLLAYGLDSLAAVELRNWVRMELGAELSLLDITNATSVFALGDKLVAKLPQVQVE